MGLFMSRIRNPTPSFASFGFGVFFLVLFWSVWSLFAEKALAPALLCLHASNACVVIEGERRETRLPPFRIIATIVFRLPFFSRSFCRLIAYVRRTKCCPFFPFDFPCASVSLFSTPAMVASARREEKEQRAVNIRYRSWRQRALAESSGKQFLLAQAITSGRISGTERTSEVRSQKLSARTSRKRPDILSSFLLQTSTSRC